MTSTAGNVYTNMQILCSIYFAYGKAPFPHIGDNSRESFSEGTMFCPTVNTMQLDCKNTFLKQSASYASTWYREKKMHKSLENHMWFEDYIPKLVSPLNGMPNSGHQS